MITFRRVTRAPSLGAAREVHFLLHSGLRAYVIRAQRVTVEKRLHRGSVLPGTRGSRHLFQIVLSGRMRLAHEGREVWLEPGDTSLQARGIEDERWEGDTFEAVVLEWSAGSCGAAPVHGWTLGRMDARDTNRVLKWAESTAHDDLSPERAAQHTAALIDLLRGMGVPLARPEPSALVEPVSASTRRVAAALGRSLSELHVRPMMVDLEAELGRSARQLQRAITSFSRYYDYPGGSSWKHLLHCWRLAMGTTLMTAPRATTESVAHALGYGSPQSFCLAMAQARLPSPGRIASATKHLR